jgi:integrase
MQKVSRRFKFTDERIRKLKPQQKPVEYRDDNQQGFYVRVSPKGAKSFYVEYRVNGKPPTVTYCMGAVTEYDGIKVAREKAGSIRTEARDKGVDPKGEKVAARKEVKARKQKTVEDENAYTLKTFLEDVYGPFAELNQKAGGDVEQRIMGAFKDLLDTRLDQITAAHIGTWRQKRLKAGKTPKTINRYDSDLRSLLNHAVDVNVILHHPFDDLPRTQKRLKVDQDNRVRYLGQHDEHEDIRDESGAKIGERERLMKALDNPELPKYMKPMVRLALLTGLRRGELFSLVWTDIDYGQKLITVRATNAKNSKTRHVDLHPTAATLLKAWRKQQTEHNKKADRPSADIVNIHGLVFPNPDTGERFTTVKKSWQTIRATAKLQDFRFHDCRHDFASRLVQADESLQTVATLLGHGGTQITERYAHLSREQTRKAVNSLVE